MNAVGCLLLCLLPAIAARAEAPGAVPVCSTLTFWEDNVRIEVGLNESARPPLLSVTIAATRPPTHDEVVTCWAIGEAPPEFVIVDQRHEWFRLDPAAPEALMAAADCLHLLAASVAPVNRPAIGRLLDRFYQCVNQKNRKGSGFGVQDSAVNLNPEP